MNDPSIFDDNRSISIRFDEELDNNCIQRIHRVMIRVSAAMRNLVLNPFSKSNLLLDRNFVYTTNNLGKVVLIHNLIWEGVHGKIPDGYEVYHINGDVLDNTRTNLDLRKSDISLPADSFQEEISSIQFNNILSVILEGDNAIIEGAPPPPIFMIENIISALEKQGWQLNNRKQKSLEKRIEKLLGATWKRKGQ